MEVIRKPNHQKANFYHLLALSLGGAIFAADTFTPLNGAIAVLYLLPLFIASRTLSVCIFAVGATCCGLTSLSLVIAHGFNPNRSQGIQLGIVFTTIAMTSIFLARDHKARELLAAANRALIQSEWSRIIRARSQSSGL
jgi:hypothetical protein